MDEISGITSNEPVSEGEQLNQAEAATKKVQSVTDANAYSTTVSTMSELKSKYPDIYDKMEMAIIRSMLKNIENFPERLKRARRSEQNQ
jgi:hypothetical protein